MTILRKTISVALVALTLGAGSLATGTAASARPFGYGGWHGGYGGWHGGYGRWHGGYGYRGGWGGPVAAGLIGGLALGAIATHGYGYGYGCHWERRPVVDEYGYVVGSRPVRICD